MSVSHVFDSTTLSDGSKCGAERLFFFPKKNLKFTCKAAVFTSSISDYAIYEVTPKSEIPATIESPKFSARIEAISQSLIIAGFGEYQNPYRDLQFSESPSCVTFLQTERKIDYSIFDGNGKKLINPMMTMLGAPCEASSGDSGGPVILRDTSVIVGIVSSGLQETFPDAEAIQALTLPEEQRVPYAKLTYVSSLAMFNEITDYFKTPSENSEALKAWLDTQFVK